MTIYSPDSQVRGYIRLPADKRWRKGSPAAHAVSCQFQVNVLQMSSGSTDVHPQIHGDIVNTSPSGKLLCGSGLG
ncbi:MAG TPA: hypothetical protein VGC55_14670 [Dokdonella sp.]